VVAVVRWFSRGGGGKSQNGGNDMMKRRWLQLQWRQKCIGVEVVVVMVAVAAELDLFHW
jgi:hypothetical protein